MQFDRCKMLQVSPTQKLNYVWLTEGRGHARHHDLQPIVVASMLAAHSPPQPLCYSMCRKWNSESSAKSRITGRAAVALKLLFENAPKEMLDRILNDIDQYGWDNSLWSAEGLANKKIFPNHQHAPRGLPSSWLDRLRTNNENCIMFVQRANSLNAKKAPQFRKKLDSTSLEAISMQACFVQSVAKEVSMSNQSMKELVWEQWVAPWVAGEPCHALMTDIKYYAI